MIAKKMLLCNTGLTFPLKIKKKRLGSFKFYIEDDSGTVICEFGEPFENALRWIIQVANERGQRIFTEMDAWNKKFQPKEEAD